MASSSSRLIGSSGRQFLGAWRSALKIAVSVGLLAWLLHRAGLASMAATVRMANWRWLGAGLGLGLAGALAQALQWRALLAANGLRRSWYRCQRLVFVGYVFNTVLPSSIGGDVVRAAAAADSHEER